MSNRWINSPELKIGWFVISVHCIMMLGEQHYPRVEFGLWLQSVTRGLLRDVAFSFDEDPSAFISWNPFSRNITLSGISKNNQSGNTTGGCKHSVSLCVSLSFFCQCLGSVGRALEILTGNPPAAASAEEAVPLSSDDPEAQRHPANVPWSAADTLHGFVESFGGAWQN